MLTRTFLSTMTRYLLSLLTSYMKQLKRVVRAFCRRTGRYRCLMNPYAFFLRRSVSQFILSLAGLSSVSVRAATDLWLCLLSSPHFSRCNHKLGKKKCFQVVKSVTMMYKVLAQQLPPEQMQDIFSRMFTLLSKVIPEYFVALSPRPSTEYSRARVLKEASFISNALLRLHGIDSKNMILYDTMRARLEQWCEEQPLPSSS